VLALDADEAGQEALKRAIDTAEKYEMNLRVAVLTGGKDPDDIVMNSPKSWRNLVKEAVSVYRYYIDWAMNTYDVGSGSGVKTISKVVAPILSRIENSIERAYYIKLLADRLDVSERVVEQEVVKAISKKDTGVEVRENRDEGWKMSRRERLERYVLALTLQFKSQMAEKMKKLDPKHMSETYTRQLAELMVELANKNGQLTLKQLRRKLPNHVLGTVEELYSIDMELMHYDEEKLEKLFVKTLNTLQQLSMREELTVMGKKLGDTKLTRSEITQLQKKYRKLKQQMTSS